MAYCLFLLKKLIGGALTPESIIVGGIFLSGGLMLLKREKAAKWVAVGTALFFLTFANRWMSNRLIASLENVYPLVPDYQRGEAIPVELSECQFVLILAGDIEKSPQIAALDQLGSTALARLTEGIRLSRLLPKSKILFSGSIAGKTSPGSGVIGQAAISLGAEPERISFIEGAWDTEDEAKEVAARHSGTKFALVTSAAHLPRAVKLFRLRGLDPYPVPTDLLFHPADSVWKDIFSWDYSSLERSSAFFHEVVGFAWLKLHGRI